MVTRTTYFGAVLFGILAAGCGDNRPPAGAPDMLGQATIALMDVPADGTCVQVSAAGNRTVTRAFAVAPGGSAVFQMGGLPVGQVTFTASAFAGACPPAAGAVPNWVSDAAFNAIIAVSPPALVTLNLVRNGSALVNIGFNDGADGGSSSSSDGGTSAGGGGPGGGSQFMLVAGVTGESTAPGFEGAFDIDNFTLDATTPTTVSSGGGAGSGKTTFAASARFRLQQGVPQLQQFAATGHAIQNVVFTMLSGGVQPSVVWRATLTNAIISSIISETAQGDVLPEETISFVFARLTIEVPSSGGGTTQDIFDITTNVNPGPPSPRAPMQFVFGGAAVPPQEAVDAFLAPSVMNPVSTSAGGGGGAGRPTFSDASVTLPFDLNVLSLLVEQADGVVTQSADVQIDGAGPAGPSAIGDVAFNNVQIHETTLSNLTATVTFGAQTFQWTFGTQTTTFP